MRNKELLGILPTVVLPLLIALLLLLEKYLDRVTGKTLGALLFVCGASLVLSTVSFFAKISLGYRRYSNISLGTTTANCLVVLVLVFLRRIDEVSLLNILIISHAFLLYLMLAVRVVYLILRIRKVRRSRRNRERRGRMERVPMMSGTVSVVKAKSPFIVNGEVVIRNGESVELLKTMGAYHSVRTFSGSEYIVPSSYFL